MTIESSPSYRLAQFDLIEKVIKPHSKRLTTTNKASEIAEALFRLHEAIKYKNAQESGLEYRIIPILQINPSDLDRMKLTTIDSLLDAHISTYVSEIEPWTEGGMEFDGRREGFKWQLSLRQALDIARYNPFNLFSTLTWGPLWGKTDTLERVESELESL